MKKLILVAALAAAVPGLSCSREAEAPAPAPAPKEAAVSGGVDLEEASATGRKKTYIYLTKNHNRGTGKNQYDTECVAIVGTERIGSQRGYELRWQGKLTNGGNPDDKCDFLDFTTVSLRFVTDVMGKDRMKILWADSDGLVEGTVSTKDEDIGAILDHKYQVYIGGTPADPKPGKPAGPDPIVVVGCSSCGPPPPS